MSNPKVSYDTFYEFVQSKSDLEWCTQNLKIAPDCSELVAGIKAGLKGTIMAISDGSFKDTYGTAAWTIGVTDGDQYISGQVICPGDGTDHSSYRSELTGIYVILAITNQLCEYYDIQEGAIEIGCDGLSALQTSFDYGPHLSYDISNYDLIGAIYHMRKMSKVSWTYRHVKGHQDKTSSDLDEWATQNVRMDTLAKQHLSSARRAPRHYNIAGEPWQLWVEGKKITSRIQERIYSAVHRPESEAYWGRKEGSTENIPLVDWPNIGYAMKKVPRARRFFITKHISGMCGVGKFMKRWREWEDDLCPRCGVQEDAPHVWLCKGLGAEERWNKALEDLATLMHQMETDPTLIHIILVYLRGWWSNEAVFYQPPRQFQELLQDQQKVGWRRFFEGWLVCSWAEKQQRYYTLLRSGKTGRRWAGAIVVKLWNIAWDMWEHRNGILHERENLVVRAMQHHLNAKVTRVYLNLSSRLLRYTDRHLVYLSLQDLLRKDNNYKATWLSVAEPSLREERAATWHRGTQHGRMMQGMRRGLFSWLKR